MFSVWQSSGCELGHFAEEKRGCRERGIFRFGPNLDSARKSFVFMGTVGDPATDLPGRKIACWFQTIAPEL